MTLHTGGGAGMVMMPDVVYRAYESVKTENAKVIYLSPQGKTLNQAKVKTLSKEKHIIGYQPDIFDRI